MGGGTSSKEDLLEDLLTRSINHFSTKCHIALVVIKSYRSKLLMTYGPLIVTQSK